MNCSWGVLASIIDHRVQICQQRRQFHWKFFNMQIELRFYL